MSDVYEEMCFCLKYLHEVNIVWPLRAWIEKTVDGIEMRWFYGKEKFPGEAGRKKDMLTVI